MPLRIIPILDRFKQPLAKRLIREDIEAASRQENYRWRERHLGHSMTLSLFHFQVFHGNTSCQHVIYFSLWTFSSKAYCQARKRLPLGFFQRLQEQVAAATRNRTELSARWLGYRVWIIDGSRSSTHDEPELQAAFGQPGNQSKGRGFPVAKWLALFDIGNGIVLGFWTAPAAFA